MINSQAIVAIAKDFRTLTLSNQEQLPASVRKKQSYERLICDKK
ncbi:MAG: hypothetical protein LBS33_00535 [Streptococcaceae bacterium]|nr:hypothetical protein [Streptococcaceae bacterium]